MRLISATVLALAVAGGGVAVAADEVTLEGTIACAKCTLKKPDAKECQNVLLVRGDEGEDVQYYISKNKVADKLGEVCEKSTKATVTGTVSEKDGRKWIAASKIEASKS